MCGLLVLLQCTLTPRTSHRNLFDTYQLHSIYVQLLKQGGAPVVKEESMQSSNAKVRWFHVSFIEGSN